MAIYPQKGYCLFNDIVTVFKQLLSNTTWCYKTKSPIVQIIQHFGHKYLQCAKKYTLKLLNLLTIDIFRYLFSIDLTKIEEVRNFLNRLP